MYAHHLYRNAASDAVHFIMFLHSAQQLVYLHDVFVPNMGHIPASSKKCTNCELVFGCNLMHRFLGKRVRGHDDYEAYLDQINAALSGNILFLFSGFLLVTEDLWGEQEGNSKERRTRRMELTERFGWSELGPMFGVPDFLSFFVSVLAVYVLVQGWMFVPEAIASTDLRNLTITAIAGAAFSLLSHLIALVRTLLREEPKFLPFSVVTIGLGVGDLIGMFVTSLNISDLLAAYPHVSVSRILVMLCCALAAFRAAMAVLFCFYCGVKSRPQNGSQSELSVDLINSTVGTFAWTVAIKLFPCHLKNYFGKINISGSSAFPAVIRSSSFLRMILLIYLNGVSLVASGGDSQFQRLSILSVACSVFDFISASYMWLFLGIWDQIQNGNPQENGNMESCDNERTDTVCLDCAGKASRCHKCQEDNIEQGQGARVGFLLVGSAISKAALKWGKAVLGLVAPSTAVVRVPLLSQHSEALANAPLLSQHSKATWLLYLKNWSSLYIMSVMDLASLVVSLVNISDIILLFNDNLRWLVVILLALFLVRASGQLLLAVISIFNLRKLLSEHPDLLSQVWWKFRVGDGQALAEMGPSGTLKLELMYLSDCSFNSFVGFVTLLFCPAALVRFLLEGYNSIDKRRPKAQSIGILNMITVIKSVINLVVCFVAFVDFDLLLAQVAVLTASLVLSLWRGYLSLAGFLLHKTIPKQISLRVTSLLWTASFAAMASLLAYIVSQPCLFAPKLCLNDDSRCLGQTNQSFDPAAICHANANAAYAYVCPPWLPGNGAARCTCPFAMFSLPHFGRKTCVNDHVFMSLGDMTCVYSFAFCMFASSVVWFYEWNCRKRTELTIIKVSCFLMLFSVTWIAASYGFFTSRHPTSSACPSWMIVSGATCSCPLSDYPVPDFERGVCVTSKSHMSQGQVAGVAVGGAVCGAILIFLIFSFVTNQKALNNFYSPPPSSYYRTLEGPNSNYCTLERSLENKRSVSFRWLLISICVFALLFGLVFGLGSSKFFPAPKAACGSSNSSFKLCDLHAECIDNACVCSAGFVGDGVACSYYGPP